MIPAVLTRREAVRLGSAAAGGALAAAAPRSLLLAAAARADDREDPAVLEAAIQAEQATELTYATGLDSGLLAQPVAGFARLFAEQEREHIDALSRELRALGGTVPEPPRPADVAGLDAIGSQTDFLELAIAVENLAVAAYGQVHRKLEAPAPLRLATKIMSAEGQHLVVLRQALGAGPVESVPFAFEAGVSPPPGSGAG